MDNANKWLHQFKNLNKDKPQIYEGNLEADYIQYLEKVQKAAKENPVDVEFDFP